MLTIPASFPVALVLGYYAYQKVTAVAVYCGGYGRIDSELGWTLRPNASSCYGMTNRLTGEVYFTSDIHTDALGFRAPQSGSDPPVGAIVAIGDSWTFGYGVDYDDTYPHHLAEKLGLPVVNLGVPAYGSAQTVLLLERHLERLGPAAVVYLTLGLWTRSVCHGDTRPRDILKPCFWINPATDQIELVRPPPGYVEAQAALGIYPGGYLTAGHGSWAYYLISRPILKLKQLLIRAGLMSGHATEYEPLSPLAEHIFAATLDRLLASSREYGFTLVLADQSGFYAEAVQRAQAADASAPLIYLSPSEWKQEVDEPALALAEHERRVTRDGHFADGMNRLIAAAIGRRLESRLFSTSRARPTVPGERRGA